MNVGFVSASELDAEQAALKQFGHSVEPIAFSNAMETLLSLSQGALHYAVISVTTLPEVLSLLVSQQLNVVGEVSLHGEADFDARRLMSLGHQHVLLESPQCCGCLMRLS